MNYTSLEKYGIKLFPLTADKIELVRNWRNNPKISQYMEFSEYITSDMQKKWFEKINNSNNNFFYTINVEGKDIGLINIKDVDFQEKTGETGIFIWDDEYLNSDYAIRAVLCIHDFAFQELSLNKLLGHTLSNNKRAIRLNSFLGYKILPNQENIVNQRCELTKDDYFKSTNKVRLLFQKN